tara:strand:- start:34317 stop:34487 length:171 start_codon:yes stop_codon:yes gene_type:complete
MSECVSFSFKGVEIEAHVADDGKIVIAVGTPEIEENENGPLMRLWLNDSLVHGELT